MTAVDLRERFGHHYRISRDESGGPKSRDPWLWLIPCRYGEIYPLGDDELAVLVTSITIANRMRREMPKILSVVQDAEDAVCFRFHVDHLERVAQRVGARTRRQYSEAQLRELRARAAHARASKVLQERTPAAVDARSEVA